MKNLPVDFEINANFLKSVPWDSDFLGKISETFPKEMKIFP
jgi:hypothetical protein